MSSTTSSPRIVMEALPDNVEAWTQDERQRFNSLRPACRIPAEILSEIFLYHATRPVPIDAIHTFKPTHRMVVNISHVCQAWRNAALHYARLWTNIPLLQGHCISAFASRSKNLPVTASGCLTATMSTITIPFQTVPLLRLESFKLECLVATGTSKRDISELELMGEEAPQLQALNLVARGGSFRGKLTKTPQMPALTSLFLSRFEFDYQWLRTLTNLTSLVIRCTDPAKRPAMPNFVGALANMKHLRRLDVVDALPKIIPHPVMVSLSCTQIVYPPLRKFLISENDPLTAYLFMKCICLRIRSLKSQIYIDTQLTQIGVRNIVQFACETLLDCKDGIPWINRMRAIISSVEAEKDGMRLTISCTPRTSWLGSNARYPFQHSRGTAPFPFTLSLRVPNANRELLHTFWWSLMDVMEAHYPQHQRFGVDTLVVRADMDMPNGSYYWARNPTFALKHVVLVGYAAAGFCADFATHTIIEEPEPEDMEGDPPAVCLATLEDIQVYEFDFVAMPQALENLAAGLRRRTALAESEAVVVPQIALRIVDCRITEAQVQALRDAGGSVTWDGQTNEDKKLKMKVQSKAEQPEEIGA